jgi:spore maturation protein CgeB
MVSKELLRQVQAAHAEKPVDLFFSYFYDACVVPEAIQEIRGLGIKTVNWYCNGSYQLHLVAEIAPAYDWCLVPEKFRLGDYVDLGARPIYCQEAANPQIYKPYPIPVEFDVTFVGQAYGERPHYIRFLLEQGIDVRVWGQGWDRVSSAEGLIERSRRLLERAYGIGRAISTQNPQKTASQIVERMNGKVRAPTAEPSVGIPLPGAVVGRPLSDLDMIRMYSRTKINLGFSSVGDTHLTENRIVQVRLRDFEVPMSGGFYMVEYMEELEEFFDIGREIVCYSNEEDLAEKIRYYLAHDEERERIRRAGYERCLRDHSWQNRLNKAFQQMGLQ